MTTIPAPRPAGLRAHLARLHPIVNRALRPLVGVRRQHQAALSEEVICQETTRFPPFIHDPDNLETAYDAAFAAVDYEKKRLRGWALEDERTVRLRFRNVLATPFGIYPLGDNLYLSGKPSLRKLLTGDLVEHDYGAYAPSRSANTFFGHWLHDALPAAFLAPKGVPIYMNERPDWPHAAQYMQRLGLSSLSSDMVFFKEMEAYYDFGMTTDRGRRLNVVRDRIQQGVPDAGVAGVFIRRGGGARRRLANEDEVAETLAARGFAVISPSDPLPDMLAAAKGAPAVVSIEGSQLAHGLYLMRKGGMLFALNPADRLSNIFADLAHIAGDRYGSVVIPRDGQDYRVDIDLMLRLMREGGAEV